MTADSLHRHHEALRAKHAQLETEIHREEGRPSPDDALLHDLKVKKLHLKEEMEGIGQGH